MTCKDCIHINVCRAYEPEEPECICNHFKNKADYEEVKHAWWINGRRNRMCSECGRYSEKINKNYCPNCGAKMDGKGDT